MTFTQGKIEDLSQEDLSRLLLDMFHRIVVHYGLWFTEVRHQMGLDAALKALDAASKRSVEIQLKRLSRQLGFQMQNGVPEPLLKMSKDSLIALLDSVSVNWLANDGVWFQAVEFDHGMNDAKRCNDSCWAHFSPFEAWSIKRLLKLPSQPGLGGLKKALQYRLYARINTQSFIEEGPTSLVFQMNDCRVQAARKRKRLEDYPCKTGGLVEYAYFARAIDPRISTSCISCPPDSHPDDYFCAWRFTLTDNPLAAGGL
jgi:hypothetical protein